MSNPEFIRVKGTLFKRRADAETEVPEAIKVQGHLYKLSETAVEREDALDALIDFQKILETAISSIPPDAKQAEAVHNIFKKLNVSMANIAKRISAHDDDRAKELWRRTGNVLLEAVPLVKRTFTGEVAEELVQLAVGLDSSLETLFDAVYSADQRRQEREPKKQMQASVTPAATHPPFIQVNGNLYRLK